MNKKSDKNILFLTRWYPSESDAMLGLFVRNHALASSKAHYKVTVAYVSASQKTMTDNLWYTITSEDNLTEVIVYYNSKKVFSKMLLLIAWFKAIILALKTGGRPALIHSHILTRSAVISFLLSKWYHIPYIITEHWSRYFDENGSYTGLLRRIMTRIVIKHASAVTVVSNRLYKAMLAQGLKFKFNHLPNVINTNLFNISKEHWPIFTFVSITCFEEKSKNLKLLIDAANKLRLSGNLFNLILIGDGTDRQMIEQYAANLNFEAEFRGSLSQSETSEVLKRSHCMVLSSNYETFGIVVYEALASGLPVVTTDVADLNKVINSSNGIVVPVGEEETLVNAMRTVQAGYEEYYPDKIRLEVSDKYSLSAISNKLDELYKSVIR